MMNLINWNQMSSYNFKGKLIHKGELVQVSEKFSKIEFVVESEEQYPQSVSFQLTNDKCEKISRHAVGSYITVDFNLAGRRWVNPQGDVKYFNSLNAWEIHATVPGVSVARPTPTAEPVPCVVVPLVENDDDLPF
jgi:hypothetical protein